MHTTLHTLFHFRHQPVILSIDDGAKVETQLYLIAVGNGQYFGGGLRITPEASLQDGLLDVCVLDNVSTPQVRSALCCYVMLLLLILFSSIL